MKDNEILKALERMSEEDAEGFSSDVLDLINRQQAEIERLESIISTDNQLIKSLNKCYEISKDEAIKEFADSFDDELAKLRDTYFERGLKDYSLVCEVIHDYLYRTLREMVGDKNE